jgi:hypothetical protein
MPKLIDSNDPYFESNGEFKKKYGTFSDPAIMGDHLSGLINDRSPEHAVVFEESINSLTRAFAKSPAAEKAFYNLVNECRAYGLVQMTLRRAKHSHYHTTEHAAELADDTEQSLSEKFKTEFSPHKADRLFIALSKAAASWHDIVQDRGAPPNNEVESAKQFVIRMNELLEDYKMKFKSMAPAVENFQKELDFLSKELIVYDTWLVFGMEPGMKLVAKPLNERVAQVIQDINEKKPDAEKINVATTPHMQRLFAACDMISKGDTKRFDMEHVLKDPLVLKALRNFPEAKQKILDNFFKEAGINSDREKEQFLGLMCQNIRIFPELNKPESQSATPNSSSKLITEEDHESYVKVCEDIKGSASFNVDKSSSLKTRAMFDNFMNAENLQGKNNIDREISFALAQQDPMWNRHAQHLKTFSAYVKKLNASDPKAHDSLAETLIELATRFQPGNYLLKKDKTFQAQLHEVGKWQKQAAANKAANKVTPLPVPTDKSLTHYQSATALLFSSAGLKTYSLPLQAKTNLDTALSRFGASYFSNLISRWSKNASFPPAGPMKPSSEAIKTIFKVDNSKLVKSEPSRTRADSVSSKSYLESRIRTDSSSVINPVRGPIEYKKSSRHIEQKGDAAEDQHNTINRPKK